MKYKDKTYIQGAHASHLPIQVVLSEIWKNEKFFSIMGTVRTLSEVLSNTLVLPQLVFGDFSV